MISFCLVKFLKDQHFTELTPMIKGCKKLAHNIIMLYLSSRTVDDIFVSLESSFFFLPFNFNFGMSAQELGSILLKMH